MPLGDMTSMHPARRATATNMCMRALISTNTQDKFRPSQATPVDNFFLAGSYTYQDYIDSMEGATKSGIMVADEIIARADGLAEIAKNQDVAVPETVAA